MKTALAAPEPRELIAIIEFNYEGGDRVYEVYFGNFIKVQGLSANGYWRDRSQGYDPVSEVVENEATHLVLAEDVYVGHWNSMEEIQHFIEYYMRGTIKEVVEA